VGVLGLEFRILGPLEVRADGVAMPMGGPRQRALLALLLLSANRAVSRDRLIEELMLDPPGEKAARALTVQVSRLRKALASIDGTDSRLVASPPGYMLQVGPGELDLDTFERLLAEGRGALEGGDPGGAVAALREAEALWRGRPLADLEFEPFARLEVERLEELRLGAVEERIEAELGLGRHAVLVPELEALVAEHPLRERLRALLMVALYRAGRQAEALEAYRAGRRELLDELGLEPAPELQDLERAILTHDPLLRRDRASPTGDRALEPWPSGGAPRAVTEPPPPGRRSVDRRRRSLAIGSLALVALVLAGVTVGSTLGGTAARSVIAADSVGAISPSGTVTAVVPVGSSPSSVASGVGAIWASNYNDNTVSRIDAASHAVVQTIPVGSTPSGLAVGAGAVWVANNFRGTVSRIDPAADRVVQTIAVGNGPSGVAVANGSVWVTDSTDGTLTRIDAITGAVRDTIALGGSAIGVVAGEGAVWVSDSANGRVLEVDPQSDQVTQAISVGTGPGSITVADGSVWVANSLDGTVSRIDPLTNQVIATIPVGDGPDAVAAGDGGVWVANQFGRHVVRIDPVTNAITRRIWTGNDPRGLAIAGGLLWVSAVDSGGSHRGGALTLVEHAPLGAFDPIQSGSTASYDLRWITNDGLTSFDRVGGSDGAQLVPDLARSLPAPADGGLTYMFRLRPGIRYSNGQLVRPEDFRRAMVRDFAVGDPDFQNIVGGAGCLAHPGRCDLSRGVVTDDSAGTVTFHLVAPDPEFLRKLTQFDGWAVPDGTPNRPIGLHALPATGPYELASHTSTEDTFVRNPYFREWSHAAQPDGYPDRIILRTGASVEANVTAVEQGRADYTVDPPPPDRLGEIQTRFASQLHVNPDDVTIQMLLNTRVAPFNDIRVRRALNYAVDRAKLAQLLGQDSRPTCQMLPPYIPGYQRYCPYTLHPNPAGVWSAPDLAKAERLIAASQTRGTPITIWSQPGYLTDFTTTARYLASLLDHLGYPTHIKTFSSAQNAWGLFADPRTKAQAFLSVATPFYPSASQFLGPDAHNGSTSCQSLATNSRSGIPNLTRLCDPQLDATVRKALAADAANSPTATALWAQADRQFTWQAAVVDFVNPSTLDLVSPRVGDYEYNAVSGVLLDQLWVR
jgi:YVTN family beta-propeller protein